MSVNRGGTAEVLPFVLKDEGFFFGRIFEGHKKDVIFPELCVLEVVILRK
jgi:hypothetical protein